MNCCKEKVDDKGLLCVIFNLKTRKKITKKIAEIDKMSHPNIKSSKQGG